jgi:hypothetical protein
MGKYLKKPRVRAGAIITTTRVPAIIFGGA